MNYLTTIIFLSFVLNYAYAQQDDNYYKEFVLDLLQDKDDLSKYFSEDEAAKSARLNIGFEDVKYKFLISYDINTDIKVKIITEKVPYNVSVIKLNEVNEEFTEVIFTVSEFKYSKNFYFKNDKLVFPTQYFTSGWKKVRSEYFDFYISEPRFFNKYCQDNLDNFAERLLNVLKINETDRELLKQEKILYYFCKDENEIEKVCGYKTKGVYLLSEDAIVTTYNSHTHEVAHLLLNFKLKNLPLYTLPFMQEGFAVAMGGRGGLSSNVLMDVGYFTLKTNFADANSILTKEGFQSEDPSITYPVSGLINQYLLKQNGTDEYISIYNHLSGDSKFISSLDAEMVRTVLSFDTCYDQLMRDFGDMGGILFNIDEKIVKDIYKGKPGVISETENYYCFQLKNSVLISDKDPLTEYKSALFSEIFPGREYKGQKYFLKISSDVVKLYNLYINELIASFDSGFNTSGQKKQDSFYIRKNFFEGKLENDIISE